MRNFRMLLKDMQLAERYAFEAAFGCFRMTSYVP